MRTKQFWLDTLERVVRTFAQALASVLVVGSPIWDTPWTEALGVATTASVLALLTSIASQGVGDPESGSVISPRHAKG